MFEISQRVQSLSPSATLAMSQKSAEMKAAGVDVINMSVGEPDFNTPDFVKDAAKRAIDDNFSHYTPVAGYLSLRQAVCRKMQRDNHLSYTPDCIVVGNGAKQELANVLLALINPGDEVIVPTPCWVSYLELVKLAEGKAVTVETGLDEGFKLTPEKLRAAITPRTRMLMLNSPSNPTGAVYSDQELEALAAVLKDFPQVFVLSDEIYEHIQYGGTLARSIASFEGMQERTAIINGVSKAYAMTGWRIGFLAAPAQLAKAVTKLQGQYTSNASSIAQKAAEAALDGPQQCVADMLEVFARRRDAICRKAAEIEGWKFLKPDGAFYLFPNVDAIIRRKPKGIVDGQERIIASSGDYVLYLLEKAHVACVDGAAFGAPGFIRLSFALSDKDLDEAMDRIARATRELQ